MRDFSRMIDERISRALHVVRSSIIAITQSINMKANNDMTKITAKIANEIATRLNVNVTKTHSFPIVLKSLIDACVKNDTTFNDDAKKIRAKIRANKSIERVMNTSHIMHNVDELHVYRYTIDNAYRVAYDRAIERASNDRAQSRKRVTKTNDAPIVDATQSNDVDA